MATTTNYGWTTPDDTALVKDGAAAIRTLGSSIDTSLNTALGTKKAGMVLLNTTSFSAVSSVSLPANTFTSTYNSYLINFDLTLSGTLDLNYRLRASGTDASGGNYNNYANFVSTVFNNGGNIANGTSGRIIGGQDTFSVGQMKIYDPATAVPTKFSIEGNSIERFWFQSAGNHTLSTAYDSLTILTSTGTITGSINAYAFNV